MKRSVIFIVVGLMLLGVIFVAIVGMHRLSSAQPVGKFITANPFDLSQISAISEFRSCEGHNYSGHNIHGEEETYRTMKHYIEAAPSAYDTAGQLRIYAPFDGSISSVADDPRGSQVYLSPAADAGGWNFIYFHVDLLPHLQEGSKFTAGEHLGFAHVAGAANFDIALRRFWFGPQQNASPFSFMNQQVLDEYAAVDITKSNIVISKEERDANPCQLAPGQSGRDAFYAQSEAGKSWVTIHTGGDVQ